MKNVFKKFAVKTNVKVLSTEIQVVSLSNASFTILTALLDEPTIENIEIDEIITSIQDRYLELEEEEQKMFIDALEAVGVKLEKVSKLEVIR